MHIFTYKNVIIIELKANFEITHENLIIFD